MIDMTLWATEITILGMAVVTLLTRVTGYWAIGKFSIEGRLKVALEVMPGAVLLSIVIPTAFATGPAEAIAATITAILALRLPLLGAIAGGVVSVVIMRFILQL